MLSWRRAGGVYMLNVFFIKGVRVAEKARHSNATNAYYCGAGQRVGHWALAICFCLTAPAPHSSSRPQPLVL
jgi:hypothetical protein